VEVLRWLEHPTSPVLYLTGLSGSGKSSLLTAWVLPHLQRQNMVSVRLRGYQDPLTLLEQELQKPGIIWKKPAPESGGTRELLERACHFLGSRRLLIVLDQFEEFVILQESSRQKRLQELLESLVRQPIAGLTFLLVFRSDYIGLVENLSLPPLLQDTNWKEVPPFTESAARDFMRNSGLQVSDDLLRDILREAAEIEQAKGLVRPVTVNLCGLVLGRFATGLPRGFRPGSLIRGFLRESITLPSIREIAPRLVPCLITGYVTKRPRTVTELAQETAIDPAAVRGCLRVLGQSDRAIVRPLDPIHQTWEISHDFLVPLLDSITARWKTSFWRRLRSWLPWLAATTLAGAATAASRLQPDPRAELISLGWQVHETSHDPEIQKAKVLELVFSGTPPDASLTALRRTTMPLHVVLNAPSSLAPLSKWSVLKNLSALNVEGDIEIPRILDLSPLQELKSLRSLTMHHVGLAGEVALKGLTNLSRLDLSATDLRDISSLGELKEITNLDLSGTGINDLSPLMGLNKLTIISVSRNRIKNVSSLRNLKSIESLDLSYTEIMDVSPLADISRLTMLNLNHTQVKDLSSLRSLKSAEFLELSFTEVNNVSPLSDLRSLTSLDLSHTKMRDVSSLRGCKSLELLDLSYTEISDVLPLKNLEKLGYLVLTQTKVSEANLLALKALKHVDIQR
jgi:uncharacterized protein YjbI with pentapeptide repeats